MTRFASHIKRKILIILFFLAFFTNLYAETVSTDEVLVSGEDSRKTITEDLTITSSGRVHCEDVTQCVKANADNLTIINRGILSNDDTDGNDLDILITANGDALDIKIYNYGTMEVDGNSAIFIPNNDLISLLEISPTTRISDKNIQKLLDPHYIHLNKDIFYIFSTFRF